MINLCFNILCLFYHLSIMLGYYFNDRNRTRTFDLVSSLLFPHKELSLAKPTLNPTINLLKYYVQITDDF